MTTLTPHVTRERLSIAAAIGVALGGLLLTAGLRGAGVAVAVFLATLLALRIARPTTIEESDR